MTLTLLSPSPWTVLSQLSSSPPSLPLHHHDGLVTALLLTHSVTQRTLNMTLVSSLVTTFFLQLLQPMLQENATPSAMLREPCITNIHDDCIAKGNCISGPNDCTEVPQTCPVVASLPEGFSRWQCVDINMEPINPYSVQPPVGTICYQTCQSWTDMNGNSARLVSVCEEGASVGAWSEAQNVDNNELAYPKYPMDGTFDTSYPTPDMDQDSALACGCEPLEVRWPYEDTGAGPGDYYDPNAEPAANFICNTEVDMSTNEYKIDTTNICVLYCDDHYVATAKCQNGEWPGNPEWGFWCYEEPSALAGGEATTPDPATPPVL